MPKRKEPELDPKEQFKRFVETSREHEVDVAQVELTIRKLTRQRQPNQKQD